MTSQADRTATLILELNQARAKLAAIRHQVMHHASPHGLGNNILAILDATETPAKPATDDETSRQPVVWSGVVQRGVVPGLGGFHV